MDPPEAATPRSFCLLSLHENLELLFVYLRAPGSLEAVVLVRAAAGDVGWRIQKKGGTPQWSLRDPQPSQGLEPRHRTDRDRTASYRLEG